MNSKYTVLKANPRATPGRSLDKGRDGVTLVGDQYNFVTHEEIGFVAQACQRKRNQPDIEITADDVIFQHSAVQFGYFNMHVGVVVAKAL